MPKSTMTLLEKISQSEAKIKQLIDQRNKELLSIIVNSNALTIDDSMLAGFLIFAQNSKNKDHSILKEFKDLGRTSKSPSRGKTQNSQSSSKRTKETN